MSMYEARQHKDKVSRTFSNATQRENGKALLLQRKVFLTNNKQLFIKEDNSVDVSGFHAPQNDAEYRAMIEPYNRYYESLNEFQDHCAGKPVSCGLIRKHHLWYRLPFGKQFFVLGEKHNYLNYYSILEESNQKGEVLGEGGTIPIMSSLHIFKEKIENVKFYSVESRLSKTLYSLLVMCTHLDDMKRKKTKKDIKHEEVEVDKNIDVRTYKNKKFSDIHYKKYDIIGTALNNINDCTKAIGVCISQGLNGMIRYEQHLAYIELGKLKVKLKELSNLIKNITTNNINNIIEINKSAIEQCRNCARNEMNLVNLVDARLKYDAKKEKEPKENHEANSMREAFMVKAILNADKSRYLMAGFGDNHVRHMKPTLEDNNIKVITYEDFKGNYSHESTPLTVSTAKMRTNSV